MTVFLDLAWISHPEPGHLRSLHLITVYELYSNTLTLYISFYTTHARQVIKSREIKTIKYTTRLKCGVLSQAWVPWVWVYGFMSSQEPHEEPPRCYTYLT